MNKNKTITIVGGGTAGLVTALILKSRLSDNIKVIKSDKIGIIGVGEGSTEHWQEFMEVCCLDVNEMIKETDATLKFGIYFENWSDKPYYHNITVFNENKIGQYPGALAVNYINDKEQVKTTDFFNLKSLVLNSDNSPSKQYHFNTFKLNEWLVKKCLEKDIEIIEDEIEEVTINNNGIDTLIGKKEKYKSDFFIDCTGFKRLLISKLGAKWQSYLKYLKLNEAIAFPTGDTDEYTPYTTATAMNNGWMWRIPVWGRHGNGYIFDNNFINAEQAKLEAEKHLGYKIEVAKNIKFEPGALDKPWIKNCMAIGLAANFVEPLEASSIATTINQAFVFVNHYFSDNQKEIERFNDRMADIMNNIRDFICLHYITKRNDTDFWKNMQNVELPDTLEENINIWKDRMAISDDFKSPNYLLFKEDNFNAVMYGLKLFKKDSIEKQMNKFLPDVRKYFENVSNSYEYNTMETQFKFTSSHKKWLDNVRKG